MNENGSSENASDQNVTRTVWGFGDHEVIIEIMPDGTVLVNGSPVEPVEKTVEKLSNSGGGHD